MPQIIDNIEQKLRPALLETLEESTALDACVGYFNLRGWDALADPADELPGMDGRSSVRVLIGMQDQPNSRLREELRLVKRNERMDNATATRLRHVAAAELRDQLTWGVPTTRDESTLRTLRRQLVGGQVVVKLYLKHNLHAKLYLCHRSKPVPVPRVGFVGSSNLTFSGMERQGELNVDVLPHDDTEKLLKWFEDRWDDRFSLDITQDLIEILDESWAAERLVSPYVMHLKVAYHLSRDARAGLIEFGLPDSMQRNLLEFQSAAVRITARNLLERGGAMIGDVVGLGKTIVATAVGLVLQEEQGFETLVVCPKNLVKMWEGYVHRYRLHAKVVSLSMVHKELAALRRYRLVVIDESHNLRNAKRRDYAAIRDYVSRNDPKVLLLTATPFNTSMADVANQLAIFVADDQDLGVRPEAAIEDVGELDFLARCDDKPSTLRAFSLSEKAEDWQRLLAQFLIRRTRRFIRDNYAKIDPENKRAYLVFGDGSKHYLPERVPRPLPFETTEDDPASDMASRDVLDGLDSLKLPRYDLRRYLKPKAPTPNPDEQDFLRDLARAGGNLLGFTRTMLMKRLSSSGAVFLQSLKRHLLRNHIHLEAIRSGGLMPIGTVDDSQMSTDVGEVLSIPVLEDSQVDGDMTKDHWDELAAHALGQLVEKDPSNVTWVRPALFSSELLRDLQADNAIILNLLHRFGTWDHRTDSKLSALERLLTEDHPDAKVLIFSEYADTATYVAGALKDRGIGGVASVTGKSEDPTTLARRFSPQSNAELGQTPPPDQELRVLVATDVLSEGQNLQDAAIIVNFDLPWAIVKLIQRAGRVDRIGQQADEVLVYTFLPTGGVEEVLSLRSRVAERLERNASVFGSDERFLNTPGEANLIEGLFDEEKPFPEGEGDEQVDYASAAYEIWRNAEENNPAMAQAALELPDVTYATTTPTNGTRQGVLVYTLSAFGVDRIGFTPLDGALSMRLSPHEALQVTACAPDTPALPRLEQHHELVQAALDGPLTAEDYNPEGMLSGVRKRVYERARNFVTDTTGQLLSLDTDVEEAVDALYRSPLTEQAKQALSRALRDRKPDDLVALVVQLHAEGRLSVDTTAEPDDIHIVCSMGFQKGPAA